MKVYTEVNWKWNDSGTELVETSSQSIEYKGELALCSNAVFDPSRGSWGLLGTSGSSKIGAIRRASQKGEFQHQATRAGKVLTGKTGTGAYKKSAAWEREWRDPWREIAQKDPIEAVSEEGLVEDPGMADILDIPGIRLPEGLTESVTRHETNLSNATLAHSQALSAADTMEMEGTQMKRDAQRAYETDMAKLSRQQGRQLTGAIKSGAQIGAAGSQSGFAQSGPVERLKELGAEQTETGLRDIEAQKNIVRGGRKTMIEDAETMIGDAEKARETAEGVLGEAEAVYADSMINVKKGAEAEVDLLLQDVSDILETDRQVHSDVLQHSSRTSDLWKPGTRTEEYTTTMGLIDAAKSALAGWDPNVGTGEGDIQAAEGGLVPIGTEHGMERQKFIPTFGGGVAEERPVIPDTGPMYGKDYQEWGGMEGIGGPGATSQDIPGDDGLDYYPRPRFNEMSNIPLYEQHAQGGRVGDYTFKHGGSLPMYQEGGSLGSRLRQAEMAPQQGGELTGPSHSGGGIDIEAEGGEYIVKKDAVNPDTLPILEEINRTGTYQGGGVVRTPKTKSYNDIFGQLDRQIV